MRKEIKAFGYEIYRAIRVSNKETQATINLCCFPKEVVICTLGYQRANRKKVNSLKNEQHVVFTKLAKEGYLLFKSHDLSREMWEVKVMCDFYKKHAPNTKVIVLVGDEGQQRCYQQNGISNVDCGSRKYIKLPISRTA